MLGEGSDTLLLLQACLAIWVYAHASRRALRSQSCTVQKGTSRSFAANSAGCLHCIHLKCLLQDGKGQSRHFLVFSQNGDPAPFRGLHPRIPIIIPTRGIGLINQRGVGFRV